MEASGQIDAGRFVYQREATCRKCRRKTDVCVCIIRVPFVLKDFIMHTTLAHQRSKGHPSQRSSNFSHLSGRKKVSPQKFKMISRIYCIKDFLYV